MQTDKYRSDHWRPFHKLEGFVRLILLVDWDPIGLLGHDRAMSQYDGYVDGVCLLLRAGVSKEQMAEHLYKIEKERMGLRGNREVAGVVADKLMIVQKSITQAEQLDKSFLEEQSTEAG